MAKNPEELRTRMSYRRKSAEELQAIVNGDYTDLEKKIAQEILDKMQGESAPEADAQPVPEAAQEQKEEQAAEKPAPKPAPAKKNDKGLLSPEEEQRLAEAEEEFEKRQKARKTPSKTDKSMKKAAQEKSLRETKRQVLDASNEVPGLKAGSQVRLKGSDDQTVGEVIRLYISSDGKEKCMVKFSDGKPVKKRVTALEIVE